MTTISRAFYPVVTVTKNASGRGNTADVTLKVSDNLIREQLRGFDGMEHAFAMLPVEKKGQLTWKKVDLAFHGSGIAGYYNRTFVDFHDKQVKNVDVKAVEKYGVAFGVETNEGVIWAQSPGNNTRATVR
ncbi:MAG: hypothetical protein AB1938_18085 [Myxococcota bacterium]